MSKELVKSNDNISLDEFLRLTEQQKIDMLEKTYDNVLARYDKNQIGIIDEAYNSI